MRYTNNKEIGDPSTQKQVFTNIKLKLLCCRYWSLDVWDCNDMMFPYWRIYWNKNEGGEIGYIDEIHQMNPDYLYIIPPFTSFYTRFCKNHMYKNGIHVLGKPIKSIDATFKSTSLQHLFIHFNLGVPFDNVFPGIIKVKLSNFDKVKLEQITQKLSNENINFSLKFNLEMQSFVMEVLSHLENELWKTINIDERVLKILRFIEINMNENHSNDFLASQINMAPNSFARLFKNEMKITLHTFIQKRKIARACELFDHSNVNIEEVAFMLGFSDRYHFSRVFKSITSSTPAAYRMVNLLKS